MSEISANNMLDYADKLPWLVFKLHDLTYTVNSRIVSAILQYPENVTPVASAPETFRGIINFRDGILPLLDLRSVFHMKSNQEDYKEFMQFINQMKTEVDSYLELIKSSFSAIEPPDAVFNAEMPFTTKWKHQAMRHRNDETSHYQELPFDLIDKLSDFELYSKAIISALKKEGADKKAVHDSIDYLSLKKASGEIHKILSDTIDTYQESYKEMVVAVASGEVSLGLIVDEVVAVEDLEIVSDEERFPKFQKTNFFVGVAHSTRVEGEILIINEDLILKLSDEFENS